jgi:mycothiol synthase
VDIPLTLPIGYQARPVTLDDADRVADLLNAAAIADTGKGTTQPAEVLSDWQQPQLRLDTDTILVLQDAAAPDVPAPAAFAIFWDGPPYVQTFLDAKVHPAHRGRGLGAALLAWGEARARAAVELAPEGARVTVREFILSSNTAAQELLASRGWQRVRYNLRMAIELAERPADPLLPEGVRIRSFVRGQDDEHFAMTSEEAFADHWGYVRIPMAEALAQWRSYMDTSPNFDSDLFLLAVSDTAGENPIVGVCCGTARPAEGPEQGWVHNLAVLQAWRRRGIAHSLLIRCFQALYDRGLWKIGLGVDADSLTGATRLYEKAGMHVERRHEFWELGLRPGV